MSGPKLKSAIRIRSDQRRWKNRVPMHMTALITPKPSIAIDTTSDPKCAQVPIENTRMMPIW